MSLKRIRFRISPFEAVLVFVFVGVLIALLRPAFRAARDVSLAGADIPFTQPSEARRIHHKNGMSLIAPTNWKRAWYHLDRDDHWLGVHNSLRYPSKLWVERLTEPIDYSLFPDTFRFHGQDCPNRVTIRESKTWDDWKYWQLYRHETIVTKGDATYSVGFETHQDIYELPPIVDQYLQSIVLPST